VDFALFRKWLAEFIGTFFLVYVLDVVTAPATSGNSFYGLAIGFAVFAQAVTVGRSPGERVISGCRLMN
jgi:aquaporin Z